jgi:hypothetical protein
VTLKKTFFGDFLALFFVSRHLIFLKAFFGKLTSAIRFNIPTLYKEEVI